MDRNDFNQHVEQVFERSKKVLIKKTDEYAGNKDVFHVFNNATGISLHDENTSVAWEMAVKHLQSIKDIIRGFEETCLIPNITQELLDEKFGDAINYFILIEGMLKEKLKNQNTPLVFKSTK